MKTSAFYLIIAICWLSFAKTPIQAQEVQEDSAKTEYKLKPSLLRMENEKLAIGLDVVFTYKRDITVAYSSKKYDRIKSLDVSVDGTLLINPDQNPGTQKAEFFWGRLISLQDSAKIILGQRPIPGKDYGSLGLGLDLTYEANQNLTEQNLEGGAEFRYMNSSKIWMPVLHGTYRFVQPVASDIREALNEDKEMYQRLNLNLQWTILHEGILVHPEFNYFYNMNLSQAIENTGLDEGFHGSFTLGYVFEGSEKPILKYLKHIFLEYNNGQLPVYADDRETIEGGLSFSF